MSNPVLKFHLPRFQELHGGESWGDFVLLTQEQIDHVVERIWALYALKDLDRTPAKAIEERLNTRRIAYDASDSVNTKRLRLRHYFKQYRDKGTMGLYLSIAESVTGVRGSIFNGQNFGVWRWGQSRWHEPDVGRQGSDIRWGEGSQFTIYIEPGTTDDAQLDEITLLYRQPGVRPAYYQIYLIDKDSNILRTV